MRFVTDFFDAAVVLPVVLVFASGVALQGRPRRAAWFLVAIAGTLATVAVAKLALAACAPAHFWIRSPSGHAASAAILAGGVSCVLSASRPVLTACVCALVVGATRYALREHTFADIVAGSAIGLLGTVLLVSRLPRDPLSPSLRLLLPCALVIAITHGHHVAAEEAIRDAAVALNCHLE